MTAESNSLKIGYYKGWYFPYITNDYEKRVKELLDRLMPTMYGTYMANCHTIRSKSLKEITDIEPNKFYLKKFIKELIITNNMEPMFRIETDDGCRVDIMINKDEINEVVCFVRCTDNNDGLTYVNSFCINILEKAKDMVNVLVPGIFFGPEEISTRKSLNLYMMNREYDLGLSYIYYAISQYVGGQGKKMYPTHTKQELMMYQGIMENFADVTPYKRTIRRFGTSFNNGNYAIIKDYNEEVIAESDPTFDSSSIPKVDLSDKEWKYINKYIDKNKYLDPDKEINLLPFLNHPRYGQSYIFPIGFGPASEDNPEIPYILTYQVHDNKSMTLYVIHRIDQNTSLTLLTRVKDVEHMMFENFFDDIEIDIINKNIRKGPKNIHQINSWLLEDGDLYLDKITKVIYSFLSMLIVMKDRPARTRMVSATYSKPSGLSGKNNTKYHTSANKTHTVRLLKTTSEAKQLVRESDSSDNKRADAVYVLEEWEREGHYRTSKNGKVSWIKHTLCRRHLPLNDEKEIKIKL